MVWCCGGIALRLTITVPHVASILRCHPTPLLSVRTTALSCMCVDVDVSDLPPIIHWVCTCQLQARSRAGGALAVHTVSSLITLSAIQLSSNAAREGGAVYIHSSNSKVQLLKCRASGNEAVGPLTTPSPDSSFMEFAAHDGGVLSMAGSNSELLLDGCSFDANKAQGQVRVSMCSCILAALSVVRV